MKIYFARHGQTDWNILRKVQGTTDIPLNENGIRQAQELCKNLEDRKISFEKLYTSYQARAVNTAQIVDEHFHSGYEVVRGLEEMNLGLFEGHNWDEILSMYAEEHKQWMSNKRYNRAPNGESYQMVMERLFRALDHIFEQHDTDSDKNLLIISHAELELPYEGAKEMILVDDVDNREFLRELVEAMYEDLPAPKKK